MWQPAYTNQFKKDYKRCLKRQLKEEEIQAVMRTLLTGKPLAARHRDHTLKGIYNGFGECHIRPDWLLIYAKDTATRTLTFIRTGTHSDLFDQ